MLDSSKGTAGSRNRASWWGKMLRIAIPDIAERISGDVRIDCGLRNNPGTRSAIAGPISCGKFARRWV